MKIYTKTGDKGQTRIYAQTMEMVSKDDNILQCYGDIDELNCHLGYLAAASETPSAFIHQIQQNLFQVGFAISASSKLKQDDILALEKEIDRLSVQLPAQTHFILPGGTTCAAQAHICRAVCRRAERSIVAIARANDVPEENIAYLNRLSDYLFTLARYLNFQAGESDIKV